MAEALTVVKWEFGLVGPEDHLVLVTDGEMSQEEASEVRERIPDALRDRVLVTSGLSAFVVKPRMTKL